MAGVKRLKWQDLLIFNYMKHDDAVLHKNKVTGLNSNINLMLLSKSEGIQLHADHMHFMLFSISKDTLAFTLHYNC